MSCASLFTVSLSPRLLCPELCDPKILAECASGDQSMFPMERSEHFHSDLVTFCPEDVSVESLGLEASHSGSFGAETHCEKMGALKTRDWKTRE